MIHTSREVTREELWLEFKKCLDAGLNLSFKTKRGFNIWLTRHVRKNRGLKSLSFSFRPGAGLGLLRCHYHPEIREILKNGERTVDFY